mmetsp:Transcript_2513/g.9014  ORF Transcript_2513/g.9014 Transcript_2513/m.9014 type:complete len:297 (-) Transcript_2513:586-1476(-)
MLLTLFAAFMASPDCDGTKYGWYICIAAICSACDKLRFCWSPLNLPFFAIGPCPPPAPPVAVPFFRFPVVFPFAPSAAVTAAACFAAFARSFSSSFAAFRSIFCFFFSSATSFASKVLAFFSSFDFVVFVVVVLVFIFFGFFSSLPPACFSGGKSANASFNASSVACDACFQPIQLDCSEHLTCIAAAPLGTSLFAYTRIGVENPLPINFASLNLTFGIACPFASLSNSKIVNNSRNAFTLFGPNGLTWFDASSMEMNKFFEFFQFDLSPKSCCVVVVVVVAEEEFGCVLPCFPNL